MTDRERMELFNLRERVKKQREEINGLQNDIAAAKTDIAAMLWADGRCEYCKFAKREEYSGHVKYGCKLGDGFRTCRPEWRGPLWRKGDSGEKQGD